jgi:methylated-DNA-[protein]-cysteine S-methyltransferase
MSKDVTRGFHLFGTQLGACGFGWSARGIDRFLLPVEDPLTGEALLRKGAPERAFVACPPRKLRRLPKRVSAHLAGKPDPMLDVPLDLSGATEFSRKVYLTLRRIGPGQVTSYRNLARKAGHPGAARAVGRAMATNPIPLLIPCHRVLTTDNRLNGFSAEGGIALKARILFAEGVILNPEHAAGIAKLRRADPKLRRIIDHVGPYAPLGEVRHTPYEALVSSIVYQQLSGKAASTIARRLKGLTPGDSYPTPREVQKLSDAKLRQAGLSRQKTSYLRDLARHMEDRRLVPGRLRRLSDEEAIASLSQVKGIGRWSAQMYLIFHLGRLDVLPVGDLGFRTAVRKVYGLKELPTPKELEPMGERWRPYRSMATWYLWQSLRVGGLVAGDG